MNLVDNARWMAFFLINDRDTRGYISDNNEEYRRLALLSNDVDLGLAINVCINDD